MTVERIRLKNFQRHKDLTVELDPKVTVIRGRTGAGKSTILRALGLVALNRWAKSYVRHGKKAVEVGLTVDGRTVSRKKGLGTNTYALDGKHFKAFGQGNVPPEVAALLNVSPDNFQSQLDLHFWFGDTSGQVSKKLNQIINLEAIDQVLSMAATESRSARAEAEVTRTRYREAKERRDALRWVVPLAKELRALEVVEKELDEQSRKASLLRSLVVKASELTSHAGDLSGAILDGKKALSSARELRSAHARVKSLADLVKKLESIELAERHPVPSPAPLVALRARGDAVSERRAELEVFVDDLTKLEEETCSIEDELTVAKASLVESGRKVRRCLACGQTLPRSPSSPAPTYTSPKGVRSRGPRKVTSGFPSSGGT